MEPEHGKDFLFRDCKGVRRAEKAEWDAESRKSKRSIWAIQKPNDLKTAITARSFRERHEYKVRDLV